MKPKHIIVRKHSRTSRAKSDWRRVAAMSESEITRAARSDPDAQPTNLEFWKDARLVMPEGKKPVTLRLDRDVLEWFKTQGRRYQSRMNAVLRLYMEACRKPDPTSDGSAPKGRKRDRSVTLSRAPSTR